MKATVESTSPPSVAQATTLKRPLSANGDAVVSAKVPKVESVDENKCVCILGARWHSFALQEWTDRRQIGTADGQRVQFVERLGEAVVECGE